MRKYVISNPENKLNITITSPGHTKLQETPAGTPANGKNADDKRLQAVSPEEFVAVYTAAQSGKEAAKVLGINASSLYKRAADLRKKGVKLKNFPRFELYPRRKEIDVTKLNNIIDDITSRLNK